MTLKVRLRPDAYDISGVVASSDRVFVSGGSASIGDLLADQILGGGR
jgi:hypothetical protein